MTALMLGGGASTVGAVIALHLHAGHRGSEGPQWIDFYNDKHFPGVRNAVSGCVHGESSHELSPRDKIQAVIHDPSSFYLSVHQLSSQPERPRPAGFAGKSGDRRSRRSLRVRWLALHPEIVIMRAVWEVSRE